jgi:hypothetical protein
MVKAMRFIMTPEQQALFMTSIEHFQEIARQNRFPENNSVPHDRERCVICHPELLPLDPFVIYLETVTQSVKVRRPKLDEDLVEAITGDLALLGEPSNLSLQALRSGVPQALDELRGWLREALSTGLELLSIHSSSSLEFSLDAAQSPELAALVAAKIEEILVYQQNNSASGSSADPAKRT